MSNFIRLHDEESDKVCFFNIDYILAIYHDHDSNATAIDYLGDCVFMVRESVEEVAKLIEKSRYF